MRVAFDASFPPSAMNEARLGTPSIDGAAAVCCFERAHELKSALRAATIADRRVERT
jgi:hypothetical protein